MIVEAEAVGGGYHIVLCSVAVGEGNAEDLSDMEPYLDLYFSVGTSTSLVPYQMRLPSVAMAVQSFGGTDFSYAGEPAGFEVGYNAEDEEYYITLDSSWPSNTRSFYGIPYTSSLALPVPSMRGTSGVAYGLSGTHWVGAKLGASRSGEFTATVVYDGEEVSSEVYSPLDWGSSGLQLGVQRGTATACIELPLDGLVQHSKVTLSTSGTREMCFEYVDWTIKTERAHRRI